MFFTSFVFITGTSENTCVPVYHRLRRRCTAPLPHGVTPHQMTLGGVKGFSRRVFCGGAGAFPAPLIPSSGI